MDDLDREIEQAARAARRRVRRGRLATIASVATFFVVGIGSGILVFTLFPEPDEREYNGRRKHRNEQAGETLTESITRDTSAVLHDRTRTRLKVLPVVASALVSAYFVSKRLKPDERRF